jgi:uncharacterized protein YyaL (SSP411 family)
VEVGGNVQSDPHNEFPGLNVLYDRRGSLASETGGAADLAPEALAARLVEARRRLFEAREKRARPHRDEKCLASWNGLMIAALARAGAILDEPAWIAAASTAADFFLTRLWDAGDRRLLRRWAGGEAGVQGQLDDYAFLAWGCLELYQAGLDPRHLDACRALLAAAEERFGDEDGLYFLAGREGDPHLPARLKDSHDNVEPSPVSVLVDLQLRLWNLSGDAGLRGRAERTLKALYADMARSSRGQAFLVTALDRFLAPPVHVVLAGARDGEALSKLQKALNGLFLPRLDRILAGPDGTLPLPDSSDGYKLKDSCAAAYVCVGLACKEPVGTPEALLELLHTI